MVYNQADTNIGNQKINLRLEINFVGNPTFVPLEENHTENIHYSFQCIFLVDFAPISMPFLQK